MSAEVDVEVNDPKNVEFDVIDREKESNEIEPTTEELNTLQHISDRIPLAAWLIVVCELCERFAFYGISGPFQNYIQFPVPGPNDKQPGALNRGQQTATLLTTFFQFFCYLTPILGAIVADQFLGKYKAIFLACLIYLVGLLVLVLTSIPPSINAGVALPGLIIAMIILGLATGGIKSNVSPFMADQYTRKKPIVRGKINSLKEKSL
jgi:POT family proton-dependent oligopeptide transporter